MNDYESVKKSLIKRYNIREQNFQIQTILMGTYTISD